MRKGQTLIATPPGYTIKEQLDDRAITQKDFALRMEMSEKHISKLINGEVLLTTDMALRLENVLGISAQFWLNLENIYRTKLAKIENENLIDDDIKIANKFPYKEISMLGWVEQTSNKIDRVYNLRKFFEVNRLGLLLENKKLNVLFRSIGENEKTDYALMAWSQKAKLEARNRKVGSINIKELKANIPLFRSMTLQNPNIFCTQLENLLEKNGIALVFLPHIGGSFLHGATFYDGNKIVIGLTVRGKDADKFWFSFFHEIGHIILGHINNDYYDDMEKEADEFARDCLIPLDKYNSFVKNNVFNSYTIKEFGKKVGIDCGIVVGRLQKDGYIKYSSYNSLKKKYRISN